MLVLCRKLHRLRFQSCRLIKLLMRFIPGRLLNLIVFVMFVQFRRTGFFSLLGPRSKVIRCFG